MATSQAELVAAAEAAQRTIPAVLRALMATHRVTGPELAEAVGMSASSLYARLNGKSEITAREVARFATYFEVPASFLYDPPAGLLRSRCNSLAWAQSGEVPFSPDVPYLAIPA